jgi:hypothetical protein
MLWSVRWAAILLYPTPRISTPSAPQDGIATLKLGLKHPRQGLGGRVLAGTIFAVITVSPNKNELLNAELL